MPTPNSATGHARPGGESGRPKVLYLLSDPGIPLYSSVKAGGVHARAMIRAFHAEGAKVEVIALRRGKVEESLPDAIRVHVASRGSMRRRWIRRYPFETARPWAMAVEALLAQRDFMNCAHGVLRGAGAPDLIYARHSWFSFSTPRIRTRTGAPLYLEVNALFAREKAERKELAFPLLTRHWERKSLLCARRILPVTQALAESVERIGVKRERIRVTPNGADLDLFAPGLRSSAGADRNGKFTIGLVSSFRPYHGVKTLIRAAALLEKRIGPVHLRLIGEGPMRPEIPEFAKTVGLRSEVELTGAVPHRAVPPLLAACDVCVAPYEGELNLYNCPMKLFEYMALKTPIVASAWGEIPDIVEHERTALLHEPASAESLADRLERVHARPDEARQRAEAAYDEIQAHTWRGHARWVLDDAASLRGNTP